MDFVKSLNSIFAAVKPKRDGDVVDRINYAYTPFALIASVMFLTGYYFGGLPIKCWFPAYFKGWWIEYALDYCFVQNTYYIPMHDEPQFSYVEDALSLVSVPRNATARGQKELTYYQWVPFILAFQALLFCIPIFIWRSFNNSAGYFIDTILLSASKAENAAAEKRVKNMEKVAKYLNYGRHIRERTKSRGFMTGRSLVILYMFVKLLYCVNIVAQFFLMNAFLGFGSYSLWGYGVLNDLFHGRSWEESGHFPRVTLCDFEVRELENVHRHTVQCLIHINMFNEKLFLFLWWWFAGVAVFTILNTVSWLVALLIPSNTNKFIATYLRKIDQSDESQRLISKKIDRFTKAVLLPDGVLVLRLIATNAGDIVCAALLAAMWEAFKKADHLQSVESSSSPTSEDTTPFLPPPRYEESLKQRNGKESEI